MMLLMMLLLFVFLVIVAVAVAAAWHHRAVEHLRGARVVTRAKCHKGSAELLVVAVVAVCVYGSS